MSRKENFLTAVRAEPVEACSRDVRDEYGFVRNWMALLFDTSTWLSIRANGSYAGRTNNLLQLLVILVLFGYTALGIAASPAKPAATSILIFGDSLSAAYGLQPEQGWPAIAAVELAKQNITVINASVSGETTAGVLSRLPEILKRYKPKIVVIALGANDGLRGLDPSAMQRNLAAMAKLAQAGKARVLIVGIRLPPNFGPEYTQMFEQSFVEVAEKQHTALLKFLLEPIAGDRAEFQADQLHPVASAQPKIWAHVRVAILPLLKKK